MQSDHKTWIMFSKLFCDCKSLCVMSAGELGRSVLISLIGRLQVLFPLAVVVGYRWASISADLAYEQYGQDAQKVMDGFNPFRTTQRCNLLYGWFLYMN